jgi:hypothetical protein
MLATLRMQSDIIFVEIEGSGHWHSCIFEQSLDCTRTQCVTLLAKPWQIIWHAIE